MKSPAPAILLAVLLGCPSSDGAKSEGSGGATPTAAKPDDTSQPRPPTAPAATKALEPSVPAVRVLAPATECATVPDAGLTEAQKKAQTALAPLRALSCKPELMGKPSQEIIKSTGTPEMSILSVGRRTASLEVELMPLADLAAAAGIAEPQLMLEQGMAPTWVVVSKGAKAPPKPWGSASLLIRVYGERNEPGSDGDVKPIEPGQELDMVGIEFGEDALAFEADPLAPKAIGSALQALAAKPSLLSEGPEVLAKELATLGERFSVSRYSIGSGDEKRVGLDIRPRRAELGAMELSQALGYPASSVRQTTISITDMNPNRLEAEGKTEIAWRGLMLEVKIDKAGPGVGLAAWTVDEITVLP